MIKPHQIIGTKCYTLTAHKFKYSLYRGDINKRYAIISSQDGNKKGRYAIVQTKNYEIDSTVEHYPWNPEGEYIDYNYEIAQAAFYGNNLYKIIEHTDTPEVIIIPT